MFIPLWYFTPTAERQGLDQWANKTKQILSFFKDNAVPGSYQHRAGTSWMLLSKLLFHLCTKGQRKLWNVKSVPAVPKSEHSAVYRSCYAQLPYFSCLATIKYLCLGTNIIESPVVTQPYMFQAEKPHLKQ